MANEGLTTEQVRQIAEADMARRQAESFDYKTYARDVQKRYREKLREIAEDPYVPDERTRYELASKVAQEYRREFGEAARTVQQSVEEHRERLRQRATVRREESTDPGVLLARQEIRMRLEGLSDDAIIERFKQGSELEKDTIVDFSDRLISDSRRREELSDLADQDLLERNPQIAERRKQLREFEAESDTVLYGLAHQRQIVVNEVNNVEKSRPYVTRDQLIGEGKLADPSATVKETAMAASVTERP